jgi:uroporphyrinogen-III synthase
MSIYLFSSTVTEGSISLPIISFTLYEKEIDLESYDTLLFTSKQAVKSAYTLNLKAKEIPALAIGLATANSIVSLGGKVLYQAKKFNGKALSQDIIEKFKEKRILYLRPKVVSFDTKAFLQKAGIFIEEEIIYETSCIGYTQEQKPMKNAILIFTSPSTIKCFLRNFEWDESYTAVVIGKATQKYLPKECVYEIANEALISSCIEKAKEISLTSNTK